jgi:hypothetical protein
MDCPFCDPPRDRVFHEDALVRCLWDAYPVSSADQWGESRQFGRTEDQVRFSTPTYGN